LTDPRFYTPDDIPARFDWHNSKVEQLGVGKAGKKGFLSLSFQRGPDGKTVLAEQVCESPLCAQRPMYFEKSLPSLAHLYIMSSSGGIVQGDRHRIDISMGPKSAAHITTQGATRIYGMESNMATQIINVSLSEGAYLEFVPDQIIPYRNSRYYQRAEFSVHDDATMLYAEIVTPGRTAMNESFEYDTCYMKTKVTNQDGKLRFVDIVNMEPKTQHMSSFGVLGEFSVTGNAYLFSNKDNILKIQEGARHISKDDVLLGSSLLADDSGLLIRMLSDRTDAIQDVIHLLLGIVRKTVLNGSFSGVRKS